MNVLEKLRISSDSDEDFPEESVRESDVEFDPEIDDGIDEVKRDPVPGEAPPRRPRGRLAPSRAEPPKVTKKHRDEAQEEIETILQMVALTWGWQAPPCGDALDQAAPDIAAKITKLVARNPKWLMKVREGGVLADAAAIAIAFKPVVQTAWGYYSQPSGGDSRGGVEFDPSQFAPYDGSGIARG